LPVLASVDTGLFSGAVAAALGIAVCGGAWGEISTMTRTATMLGRHVYRVHPIEQGWTVRKDGETWLRGSFTDRDEAIAEAERLARSDEPAKIVIDKGDGVIAEERLFGIDPIERLGV